MRRSRALTTAAADAGAHRMPVPAAADRAASAGPWVTLVLGALLGGICTIYSPPVAATLLVGCVLGSGVLFVASERVRRLSRWTAVSSLVITLALTGGLCAIGCAIATARLAISTAVWVLVLFVGVAGLVWRNAVRRRETEWENERATNEGEVLDLGRGTFDVTRGFQFSGVPRSRERLLGARALPWVAVGSALVAGSGGHLQHGLRESFLMVAGPAVFVGALPGIALIFTTWRKIVAYERQLGRDILNR